MKTTPDTAYLGLPGTGKTTALMDELAAELDDGRPVSDIAASTFRTDMAAEFQGRAREVVGDLPDGHKLRTTHSLCFRLLGLSTDAVVDDEDKQQVCDNLGIPYGGGSGGEDQDWYGSEGGAEIGNELFRLVSYCRNTQQDPVQSWRQVHSLGQDTRRRIGRSGGEIVERFVDEYTRYKADNGLIDFDGMLEECLERELHPEAGLLIEDEFQDKSALQVAVFEMWADHADRVIVAGDPYQAIYRYMGAKPEFMEQAHEQARNPKTLDRSYRFGDGLWSVATEILTRAGYDVPEIEPTGETDVHSIDAVEYRNHASKVADEDTLHLTRCNYMLADVAGALSDVGIPFDALGGGHEWTSRQLALYNGMCKVRDVLQRVQAAEFGSVPDLSTLSLPEVEAVIKALKAGFQRGTKKGNIEEIEGAREAGDREAVDAVQMIDTRDLTGEITEGNPFSSRLLTTSGVGSQSIRRRLRRTFEHQDGDPIREINHAIGTIHAAKGMGATNVFLHNEIAPSIAQDARPFPRHDKDEARVFFVGATRAADRLFLVDANESTRFRFPNP